MNICIGYNNNNLWFRVQFGKKHSTSEFFKDVQNSMIPKPGHECNLKPLKCFPNYTRNHIIAY